MSFTTGGITFYEPGDLTVITSMGNATGVLVYYNNEVRRITKDDFKLGMLPAQLSLSPVGFVSLSTGYHFLAQLSAPYKTFNFHANGSTDGKLYLYPSIYQIQMTKTDSRMVASQFVILSSAENKENITPIEKGLAIIEKISPSSYTINGIARIGLVAENLQAAGTGEGVQSIVDDIQQTETIGIDIMAIVTYLIKAVQELSTEIKNLKEKMSNVEL